MQMALESECILKSHYLKVETGRWSRIPRNNRVCACGTSVQTEEHILLTCPLTCTLRSRDEYAGYLHFSGVSELMESADLGSLAAFCHRVLCVSERL